MPAPVLDGDPSDRRVEPGQGRDHPHGQGREQSARPRGRDGEGHARRQAGLLPVPVGRPRRELQALPAAEDREAAGRSSRRRSRPADENVYYEDKLSMYITDVPNGSCAAHLSHGRGPARAPGARSTAFTTPRARWGTSGTGSRCGRTPWAPTRTSPASWTTSTSGDPSRFRRYPRSATPPAITRDPGRVGYDYNFVKLDPKQALGADLRPTAVPARRQRDRPNPDPKTSEQGETWWIQRAGAIPYSAAGRHLPGGHPHPEHRGRALQGGPGRREGEGGVAPGALDPGGAPGPGHREPASTSPSPPGSRCTSAWRPTTGPRRGTASTSGRSGSCSSPNPLFQERRT